MEFWCLLFRFYSFNSRKVTEENKCIVPILSFLFLHALLLALKADTIVIWVDKPLCSWSGIERFNSYHCVGLLCLQGAVQTLQWGLPPWRLQGGFGVLCSLWDYSRMFLFFSHQSWFCWPSYKNEFSQAKYIADYWYQIIDTNGRMDKTALFSG